MERRHIKLSRPLAIVAPPAGRLFKQSSGAAGGATGVAPQVALEVPLISGTNDSGDTCSTCLPSDTVVFDGSNFSSPTVQATVTASATSGRSIAQVILQYSPSGTGNWQQLQSGGTLTSAPYHFRLGYLQFGLPDGDYDVRAAATDSAGETGYSSPVHVALWNPFLGDAYIGLQNPGSAVRGTVALTAAPAASGGYGTPTSVTFQISPAGAGQWTTIAANVPEEVDDAGNPVFINGIIGPLYTANLDTTTLPDGTYDVQVQDPNDPNGTFIGDVTTLVIDNTPPTVNLANPGASLSGVVTLSATAQDAVSGVASVRFEYAPAGSGTWSPIGLAASPPYTQSFDTRALQSGTYDLRAVATNFAGDTAVSVVSGVSISNPTGPVNPASFTISDEVVPATGQASGAGSAAELGSGISLLGEIAGSADHETWAYGYTTAPPAIVNGAPLPYTAPPGTQQLVLLRYTDRSGWQIADVLRNADGSPFDVPVDASVFGHMTPSGEAWMGVVQNRTIALFHRQPNGQFLLDPAASAAVQPLFAGAPTAMPELSLDQGADGSAYGVLLDPDQAAEPTSIVYGGSSVSINAAMRYAVLANGAWKVLDGASSLVQGAQLPADYVPSSGDTIALTAASPTGPQSGWGVFTVTSATQSPEPLLLASFGVSGWQFAPSTGLDALDLTGNLAFSSPGSVVPSAIKAASDGVWLSAGFSGSPGSNVVALFDPASSRVVASWCTPDVMAQSTGCGEPLDPDHPASVPDSVFDTPQGPVGLALGQGFVDVYAHGAWTSVAAPGFAPLNQGNGALFTDAQDGWLAGPNAMGRITAQSASSALAPWPEANQATLTSVALPPAGAGVGTPGALAVGLDGTALHYDSSAGWLVDPVPARARSANLLGVAFGGPSQAVAVGSFGTILDWDGTSWSEDPQSMALTNSQLNAVAFGSDGEGWAVGAFGTILHYDGGSWSTEQVDSDDAGADITSVTVAGSQVFAVAGGNLITRQPDGTWERVDPSLLPAALPPDSLTLVSGLPDGGVVVAGKSVMLVRQDASSAFKYSDQPIQGIAVALAAFRDSTSGEVRAFVSIAPPATVIGPGGIVTASDIAGFPAGDGELLKQTSTGWQDLSQDQNPNVTTPPDGAPEPNPVLAVAATADGSAAWAVGGYAGTQTAAGLGSDLPLSARPFAWQTSSIWRYDAGGSATAPSLTQAQVSLPAQPNTVSFAFFSSALCISQCSSVQDAQPDVNLRGATSEIADFASQPGGPAFAMLGGDAVGPLDGSAWDAGNGAEDLSNLSSVLAPLGGVPLYAAYGPLDAVPTSADPAQPWDDAFAQSPAPFGLGAAPSGITPVSSGGADGSVNHYYSFDVAQNGGTLRVIVLDNSAGSLAAVPGETAWLDAQLAGGQAAGVPMVVVCALPLTSDVFGAATDGDAVAAELAAAGVLAVFTTSVSQSDREIMVPDDAAPGAPQIPEYEGATLGYQQTQNNGVLWYFVSVDTSTDSLTVQGIPVIQSLALEPLAGLSAARSSTLSFRAVGRRPPGTLAAQAGASNPQGYANYVAIPSPSCSGCVAPSYTFTSSNPAIGDFVKPSGPGSQFPALSSSGKPIHSSTSGLFCAYNAGTTTVSVTSGLLTSSLTVTVQAGAIGQPCGTVTYVPGENVITVPSRPIVGSSTAPVGGSGAPPSPAPQQTIQPALPKISLPPPPAVRPVLPSAPHPRPAAARPPAPPPAPVPPPPQIASALPIPPVLVPLVVPPVTPVPPGGATVSAQATARREERARKHASQSAFTTRPAGTSATDWFYPAVGIVGLLALLLAAEGMRPRPRPRFALLESRETNDPRIRPRPRRRL